MCELRMKHEWNLILAACYQLKQLKNVLLGAGRITADFVEVCLL